jgi:Na+/serine symporter
MPDQIGTDPMPLRQLYSVPVGLLLGIALALLVPAGAPYVAWLGQIFISMLKLLILPLILVSIYASLRAGAICGASADAPCSTTPSPPRSPPPWGP